jgi:hypothetical protein
MPRQRSIHTIYHLADERNWLSIQKHGLLSSALMLKKHGLDKWISCHRTENLQLPDYTIIRDQRPMPPTALSRCLAQGLTPNDWYALLNQRIFFWIALERLHRQRQACNTPQYILTIDTERLLAKHAWHAAVTPFNTGNAKRAAARRGAASFVPYDTWLNSGWDSEAIALGTKPRPLNHKPVEFTITDAVPDIFNFIIDVQRLEPDE